MAVGGALGDVGPALPGALAPLAAAALAQPQITTLGVARPADDRGPLDIKLDGIAFKLFLEEPGANRLEAPASLAAAAYTAEEVDPLLPRFGSGTLINYGDFPTRDEVVVAQDSWIGGLSPVREQRVDATYWTSQGVDARRPQQLVIQPQKFTIKAAGDVGLAGPPVDMVDCFGGVFMIAGNTLYQLLTGTPPTWRPVLAIGAGTFSDLTQYNNLLLAAASWPAAAAAATIAQLGAAGAVRYDYQIVPILPAGDGLPSAVATTALGNAALGSSNFNRLTWPAVANATGYKVLRVFSGGIPASTGLIATLGNVLTFDDTGLTAAAYTATGGYYYSTDGQVWTQVTGSGDAPKADLFTVIRSVLWKAVKPNKLYATTDPTSPATWNSTPTQVGDNARNINSIAPYLIDIAVGKEDGVWTVDRAGNDFPIVPELKAISDPKNCSSMKQWRSGLHFRVRNGLFRYDGRLLSLGLDRYRAPRGGGQPLVLSVADTAAYTNELVVALQVAGQQGMYLASLYDAPWRWHLWGYDARYRPTLLFISANAFTSPTVWVGQDDGAGGYSTGYVRMPSGTDNPLDDPGYTYQPGSWTLTSTELAPLPDQDKNWNRVTVRCPVASPQATIGLAYAADGDIEGQAFTRMVGPQGQLTQYGLLQEWFFPDPKGVNARSLQLQLILTTSDPAQTPAPRHVVTHFKHMAFPRNRFKVALICEDRTAGADYQLDERSAEDLFFELLRMRTVRRPVEMIGMMAERRMVYLERLDHRLLDKGPDGRNRFVAVCTMLEFQTTTTPAGPPQDPS